MSQCRPDMLADARGKVARLLLLQGLVAVLSGLIAFVTYGVTAGWSALLGGLIYWIPNSYFGFRVFRISGAQAAKKIVGNFYRSELMKLVLTAALFALVFQWLSVLPAALFAGFMATLLAHWFAFWVFGRTT